MPPDAPLTPDAFRPLPSRAPDWVPVGAPEGYWHGVWRRLARNPMALVSLGVVVGLLAFTLLGPWLWPADPARQSPTLASHGVLPERDVLLVADDGWQAPAVTSVSALTVREANTVRIRLVWPAVPGAREYRVYRHRQRPTSNAALGIPLGAVSAGHLGYEDRLNLRQRPYYYSVVARHDGGERTVLGPVTTTPTPAIGLLHAQLQGDWPASARSVPPGTRVRLTAHPLGTDYLGRDMLARLIAGARTSLLIGIFAPLAFIAWGTVYGAISAYAGGRVDEWLMRIADFVIALPFLLFMILIRIAFGIGPGESGIVPLIVALMVLGWPMTARLVRGQMLQLREQPYVAAARLMGASGAYIIFRHLLPNVLGVILVSLTFAIPAAIFTEAFLSFIGMGVAPPTPSWGSMCNDGIRTLLTHPRELLLPSLLISLTVLAFNLLGDGLRDALDVNLERAP